MGVDLIFQLLFMGVTSAVPELVLITDENYSFPAERDAVVAVSYHLDWYKSDSECKFTGLMVPFSRDWTVEVDNTYSKSVVAAEPDVTAGHAFVINKKSCPGKEPEFVFRVDETSWVNGKAKPGALKWAARQTMLDFRSMREDQRPKWFKQVMARIERVAASDQAAKDFLAFQSIGLEQMKAASAK